MIVERDFCDHPKTVRLARALGPDSPLLMLRIWGHCEARRSPALGREAEDIAAICRWPGDAQTLLRALLTCRWIDDTPDGYLAHGWAEANAGWLAKVQAGRDRVASALRQRGKLAPTQHAATTQLPAQLANPQHPRQLPAQLANPNSSPDQLPLSHQAATSPASTQLPSSIAGAVEWSGVENPPTVPTGDPEERSSAALEDTRAFICTLFGRKKIRLGGEAERQLATFADSLPFTAADKAVIAWFMALPDDEKIARRPESSEAVAKNPLALLERARACAKKSGAFEKNGREKNAGAPPDPGPDGWPAHYRRLYPRALIPTHWSAVDPRLQTAIRLELTAPVPSL